jgi:hypothetical protein
MVEIRTIWGSRATLAGTGKQGEAEESEYGIPTGRLTCGVAGRAL